MNLPVPTKPGGPPPTREQAEAISKSKLLPSHFGDPASIQYVMQIGYELGISPVTALSWVHVFADNKGKLRATFHGHLMQALAHLAGHRFSIKSLPDVATAKLLRREIINGEVGQEQIDTMKSLGIDPKEFYVFEDVWNVQRARDSGLDQKPNWKLNKQTMLVMRAKVNVVRMGAPEVLMGAAETLQKMGVELDNDIDNVMGLSSGMYAPEELGFSVDEEGNPLGGQRLPLKKPKKAGPTAEQKLAEKIKDFSGDQIVALVNQIVSGDITPEEKTKRISLTRKVISSQERAESPVIIDGESVPLLAAIDAVAEQIPAS